MTLTFELGIDSSTAVNLRPNFDYQNGKKQIRNDYRTKGGRAYRYKWGEYRRIKFTAEYVPASAAAVVNSWFDSNTELLWFITSGDVTEVHSVMIMNDDTPFQKTIAPYDNLYKGKIELEGY